MLSVRRERAQVRVISVSSHEANGEVMALYYLSKPYLPFIMDIFLGSQT